MNVLCIYGSPHSSGNSGTIAHSFLEGARRAGAEVKMFELNKLEYSACTACMACKTERITCILDDDLSTVMDGVREADILVLASPIYAADVSAAMKAFLERTHCFLNAHNGPLPGESRLLPGKKLVFILAQGCPEEKHQEVYQKYRRLFEWYGFEECYLLRACDVIGPGEVMEKNPGIIVQAKKLAEEICRK